MVLNVWSDHVSTYTTDAGNHVPGAPSAQEEEWAEDLLVSTKTDDDQHRYDDMLELNWL